MLQARRNEPCAYEKQCGRADGGSPNVFCGCRFAGGRRWERECDQHWLFGITLVLRARAEERVTRPTKLENTLDDAQVPRSAVGLEGSWRLHGACSRVSRSESTPSMVPNSQAKLLKFLTPERLVMPLSDGCRVNGVAPEGLCGPRRMRDEWFRDVFGRAYPVILLKNADTFPPAILPMSPSELARPSMMSLLSAGDSRPFRKGAGAGPGAAQ